MNGNERGDSHMQENMQLLRVSADGRRLTTADGQPFFWLGDTAWELFHKLLREEAEHYLRQRESLGFNVVQAVALAELDGLEEGNAYGRTPLLMNDAGAYDPSLPDTSGYSYWDHMDYIIEQAAELGIYVALLPTWGDKFNVKHGKGPVIFTPSNARQYGKWLGARYRDCPNIIWVLGGDRPMEEYEHFAIIRGMAEGLKEGDGGAHLMSFHPAGARSSSLNVHREAWLDFNMIQSGHGEREITNYARVQADYRLMPAKPTLDGEPCYEDIPIGFDPRNGYFDASDVRRAAYYAVFSGALGHTYGHHSVWSMTREGGGAEFLYGWQEALHRPGAAQMQHLRALMEAYSECGMAPDDSVLASNLEGANRMVAMKGERCALVYSPNGVEITVSADIFCGERMAAAWYDPRTGIYREAGDYAEEGTANFRPPTSGRGQDWVLAMNFCE
ncbi:hypothetical protein FHS18_003122 [Paenibacillus phyllosphaerae]|uniref:DUF4038 domain-containing protein n=1 Tax=Paenibacillus phyllosphaerae TaxID=274593 RepID=A0A7W5AZ04_9BACL|nr:glycoside hydrolase family 140 protein [Paenibacillus phyllosphaerae]MBB3111054.1 hypothetical protein [Paenibacillus phyllosphaerae]